MPFTPFDLMLLGDSERPLLASGDLECIVGEFRPKPLPEPKLFRFPRLLSKL